MEEVSSQAHIMLHSAVAFSTDMPLLPLHPGHINHTLFWENLAPTKENGGRLNDGKLDELIQRDFGSLDGLKKQVNAAAAGIQGSGWAWVGVDPNTKRLAVSTTANQDPLLDLVPLFGIDMW